MGKNVEDFFIPEVTNLNEPRPWVKRVADSSDETSVHPGSAADGTHPAFPFHTYTLRQSALLVHDANETCKDARLAREQSKHNRAITSTYHPARPFTGSLVVRADRR